MKVLLAVDGSRFSEAATSEVAARVWPANAEIKVITAFELPLAPAPEVWALTPDYMARLEHVAREHATAVNNSAIAQLDPLKRSSIRINGEVLPGSPRSVILKEAEYWKADLIVIGSHGYGAWQRLLLGSVSQAVVSHAKCSVEVVRISDRGDAPVIRAARGHKCQKPEGLVESPESKGRLVLPRDILRQLAVG